MSRTVLILGASGRFGRNAANAFAQAGWTVRKFDRARDDLKQSLDGVQVVVNGWNPPDYTTWHRDLLPMHRRLMDAMQGSDATVILPANVYVFAPTAPAPWSERTKHAAPTPLGRMRVQVEDEYKRSGLRVIVLRCGDFLDTCASGQWFDLVMAPKVLRGKLTYPGRADIAHAWAYLPDVARAAVHLVERRAQLPCYADIPFPGYTLTALQMAEALERVTGRPMRVTQMAWWPLALLSPIKPLMRHLRAQRYLWDTRHALDGKLLRAVVPDFQMTPVDTAMAAAIQHLGPVPGPEAGQLPRA
ncbi:epimerase [Aliishimia ponticola]|uniref:Epimerase n=2 Tax=Aliishimia ponticola TaxID=2499833 RepID=A0A4V3XKA5_9RHOB|nr:epimerase [Aliishimia ponticola]